MGDYSCIGISKHRSVDELLDAFSRAASCGDLNAYFGCFYNENSRFLGTDINENWTCKEFLDFARPHFKNNGTPAWIYLPLIGKRKIDYIDKSFACFDEHLSSESFKATSRGSGTCIQKDGHWFIVQYYLSFPIPNQLAKGFCDSIARWEKGVIDAQNAQLEARKISVAATVQSIQAARSSA